MHPKNVFKLQVLTPLIMCAWNVSIFAATAASVNAHGTYKVGEFSLTLFSVILNFVIISEHERELCLRHVHNALAQVPDSRSHCIELKILVITTLKII